MSYNSSIPNVTDFLAISQKQILANYQAINNSFAENHIALGLNNQGQHDSLTLRPQVGDPTTAADQAALYTKLVSSVPQLFFRPSSNQTPIQMNNTNINTTIGANQVSFLPGPFNIFMGFVPDCASGTVVTLLGISNIFYVGCSEITLPNQIPTLIYYSAPVSISGNTFKIQYETGITPKPTVYYMAIGI